MARKKTVVLGNGRPVVDLFYSPITSDGLFFLITPSNDAKSKLINGESGDCIRTFEGHRDAVWSHCLDSNASHAATAPADYSSKVWNAPTGQELYSFEHEDIVRSCAFSELEPHLLLTGCEKKLRVFDLNRPETPRVEIDQYSFGRVRTVAWLPNGYNILSSSTERNLVRIWDIRAGHYTLQTLQTTSPATSVEVSRDGGYITTANGSTVSFWDANGFGLVKSYTGNYNVASDSLEPTSAKRFIAGGEDMCVRIFDFEEGKEIKCNNHIGAVHSVRFSPGGESYASGSDDGNGTVMLWEMDPVRHRNEVDARDSDAHDSDGFEANAHDSNRVEADVHDSDAHDSDSFEADAHDSDDEDNGRNKMGSWIFCKLGACSVL